MLLAILLLPCVEADCEQVEPAGEATIPASALAIYFTSANWGAVLPHEMGGAWDGMDTTLFHDYSLGEQGHAMASVEAVGRQQGRPLSDWARTGAVVGNSFTLEGESAYDWHVIVTANMCFGFYDSWLPWAAWTSKVMLRNPAGPAFMRARYQYVLYNAQTGEQLQILNNWQETTSNSGLSGSLLEGYTANFFLPLPQELNVTVHLQPGVHYAVGLVLQVSGRPSWWGYDHFYADAASGVRGAYPGYMKHDGATITKYKMLVKLTRDPLP